MWYLLLYCKLLFLYFYAQGPCISEQLWKGFLEEKRSKNKNKTGPKICAPTHRTPPYQKEEEHGLAVTGIYKSGHCNFAKSLNPELTCSPREAMLDEDGYITLNIKNRKPPLTSGKNTQSQGSGS